MADQRDSAVTSYVRLRIREWEASGQDQRVLARKAGVSAATISQVKTKTGVGSRSIDGFATAFGFPSAEALRKAAYQWLLSQGAPVAELMAEPKVVAAIETVLGLRPGITRVQIETILHGFTHERFRGRDESYWVPTLLAELQMERRTEETSIDARKTADRDKRAHKTAVQGAIRTEHRRRKAAKAPKPRATDVQKQTDRKAAG